MKIKVNCFDIEWDSSESHYFFNPKHPKSQNLHELANQLPYFPNSIYLFTSSFSKICILSKQAFLTSAEAVNSHLETSSKDKWLLSLPLFHVGGLSVLARSFLNQSSFSSLSSPWNPKEWLQFLESSKATLTSIVPSQVHDLVKQQLKPPKGLRAVVVGGDSLSPYLYQQARKLKWPLLLSYGLTEACSQVATSEISSLFSEEPPSLKILNHIKIRKQEESLQIQSDSLLKFYFDPETKKFFDPKKDSWFTLEDQGVIRNSYLEIQGRKDEQVKILGEWVDFKKLKSTLEEMSFFLKGEYCLLILDHSRKGKELNLVTTSSDFKEISFLVDKWNKEQMPYERLEKTYHVPKIEKNSLFKIRQENLKKTLGF